MDKTYLDTCIISGLVKEDLPPKEQNAVIELLELHKKGKIHLVTSEVSMRELEKIPLSVRKNHEIIYLLLENVPISNFKWLSGIIGGGIIPFPIEDSLYTRLKVILKDENDRQHVFHAIKNNCNYFVTTDRKTILKHNTKLFLEFDEFMVLSPSEIIELLKCPI